MRGQAAVKRFDRPAIRKRFHAPSTGVNHRFNGNRHPAAQSYTASGDAEIRHLGVLVQLFTDTVTDEITHDGKAVFADKSLNSCSDIAYAMLRQRLLEPL